MADDRSQLAYAEGLQLSRPGSTAAWFAFSIMWVALGFFIVSGICLAVGVIFGSATGYLTPAAALICLIALSLLLRSVRRDRDQATLNYLEQAARLNLPLPAMLHAAEICENPQVRRRLRVLRSAIEEGLPIGAALELATPSLEPRLTAAISVAERNGQLAAALGRAVAQKPAGETRNMIGEIYLRWYPLVLLVFVGGTLGLMGLVVLPRIQSILQSFHIPRPAMLTVLMVAATSLAPLVGILSAIVLLIFCGRMFSRFFTSRSITIESLRWPGDLVMWHLPFAGRVVRGRALAEVCQVLADAARLGRPLPWAIFEAAEIPGNVILQRKLRRWARLMVNGVPLDQAARVAGMPKLMTGLTANSPAAGDAPEIFEFLGRYYQNQFSRGAMLLRGALFPMLAIFFGAIVAAMAFSIFQPLIKLADALIPSSGGF